MTPSGHMQIGQYLQIFLIVIIYIIYVSKITNICYQTYQLSYWHLHQFVNIALTAYGHTVTNFECIISNNMRSRLASII